MKSRARESFAAQIRAAMSRLRPSRHFVLVLGVLLIAQLVGAAALLSMRTESDRLGATEPALFRLDPDAKYPPAPTPTPKPVRKVSAVKKPAPVASQRVVAKPKPKPRKPVLTLPALRGLGAWVDLYDYGKPANTPVTTLVAQAASQHVSTIWVETSRFNTADIAYPDALGALMDASASRGIRVIAWVLPEFRSVSADLAKAKAAAAFRSPRGHRFAALGIDIEVSSGAKPPERTAELNSLMRGVYGHVGMSVVAITPPPVGFSRNPSYWPGFPWHDLAAHAHAIATMGYWSFSHDAHPDEYTASVLRETRSLVGNSSYPIHVIGGLAADTTPAGAAAFCRAARSGGAVGASLYDLTSTPSSLWAPLQACRKVGY
ncbi:MAG: hypothetical protein QOG53_3659 [Frankiales bacterium]|jgi:hypothetical protein|nr:hypothetical protein [Frankiales bacterium]